MLGKNYPSGKLATTWARLDDYPAMDDFAQRDDTCYREGIYVGYRYFDAAGTNPIFPFGFGLGYKDFEITADSFEVCGNTVVIQTAVKNIGNYAGKETVQLYYSAPQGKLGKPVKELGAYAKTRELSPGESEILTLTLPIENMASWDTQKDSWFLEKGEYVIGIGST